MKQLGIDIETYSATDLTKCGVHKYTEDPEFEIIIFGYKQDDSDEFVGLDIKQGEVLPEHILLALTDPAVKKTAHNAAFEMVCIYKHYQLHDVIDYNVWVEQWECTMVRVATLGLPFSLDAVSNVLNLKDKKDSTGKALIRYFSIPCKPTKANGMRTRNLPEHDPVKWQQYISYNIQDVKAEQEVIKKIAFHKLPDWIWDVWYTDQRINKRGVQIDVQMVESAVEVDAIYKEQMTIEAIQLTQLTNPNSLKQLKEWLSKEMDEEVLTLRKNDIPELLDQSNSETVTRVLQIRQELSKSSIKKYVAMLKGVGVNNRIRGLFQFCGANRTWRWTSKMVQLQNLPRNSMKLLDDARNLVKSRDLDWIQLLWPSPPDVLSQLIRTAFVPKAGHRFIVSDYAQIELVVAAWLAGEQWVVDAYNNNEEIYKIAAARMLNKLVEEITKEERQTGKVSTLACQYGGGVNAIAAMAAMYHITVTRPEGRVAVKAWRSANPKIVEYWRTMEAAAHEALKRGKSEVLLQGVQFHYFGNILYMQLPSGRRLAYPRPKVKMEHKERVNREITEEQRIEIGVEPGKYIEETDANGNVKKTLKCSEKLIDPADGSIYYQLIEGYYSETIFFEGIHQKTNKWMPMPIWGGLFFQNLTQGVAADCLMNGIMNLEGGNYPVVMHVHDETISEVPNGYGSVEEVAEHMTRPAPWFKDLRLKAEGYETEYYKKD